MVHDIPLNRHGRESPDRYGANLAALTILEDALTAVRENSLDSPVNFALMVSQGSHFSCFTSDGLRHVGSSLFSEHFKDIFLGGLHRSPRSIPRDPNHTENWRPSHSSHFSTGHHSCRSFPKEDRNEHDSSRNSPDRKRPRTGTDVDEDNTPVPNQISIMKTLNVGDRREVAKYYTQIFKDLQQTACKVIAKAFIKIIEPAKQSKHPYTKGAAAAPLWWPLCPPPGHKGAHPAFVRHKEPDHLYKDERVRLCVHILHVVNSRDADRPVNIKSVTIRDLERVTQDAMARDFFNDKDGKLAASNPDKRPLLRQWLRELFYVAKQEERFNDGGLDADAAVKVMHGGNTVQTDLEEDGDLENNVDEESVAERIHMPDSVASSKLFQRQNPNQSAPQPKNILPMHTGERYISTEEQRYRESGIQTNIQQQQQQQFLPDVYRSSGIQELEYRSALIPNFTSTSDHYSNWTRPPNNWVMASSIHLATLNPTHPPTYQPYFPPPHLSPPSLGPAQMYFHTQP